MTAPRRRGRARSPAPRARPGWEPLGDSAIRIARPPGACARALLDRARSAPGVVDVVVGPDAVGVYFAERVPPGAADAVAAALAAAPPEGAERARPPELVALRVIYDGADLPAIAARAEATVEEVIEAHAAGDYTVDAMGFLPGFAYLVGLPGWLEVPRRATPRARVPAGSVAIAARYTAIYPSASPGGWSLVGRIVEEAGAPPLFGEAGARLQLGDRVRFVRAGGAPEPAAGRRRRGEGARWG